MGLAHGVKLNHDVSAGAMVTFDDVSVDESLTAVRLRRQLESDHAGSGT